MRFKLDENLPVSSAAILADAGHDVDTVGEEGLSGAPDPEVVAAATEAGRARVSLDVRLGDIRAYLSGSHAGIVVLRLTAPRRRSPRWRADVLSVSSPACSIISAQRRERITAAWHA